MSETFSEAFDDPPESRSEQSPATRARQPANERCQSTPGGSVKATRRTFSRAEKLRILEAADRCSAPGEIGELLRREGVYSSHLAAWRKKRAQAGVASLEPDKRGPKTDPSYAALKRVEELTRENERLRQQLVVALAPADQRRKARSALVDALQQLLKHDPT